MHIPSGDTDTLLLQPFSSALESALLPCLEYDVEKVIKEFETSGLNEKAPYWSKINIHTLRTGNDKNLSCLNLAMKLCEEEEGSVSWPDIPEKYWQQAVREFGIEDEK